MPYNYYGGYPTYQPPINYYNPPAQDNLAQLRASQMPPMQQPMQPVQQQAPTQPVNNNMIWVQGEAGAKSFLVANGNTVPLWDSENQTVYIKTVDASGIPSMRVLDYTERTEPPKTFAQQQTAPVDYVTRQEFQAVLDELETLKTKKCSCTKKPVKEEKTNE